MISYKKKHGLMKPSKLKIGNRMSNLLKKRMLSQVRRRKVEMIVRKKVMKVVEKNKKRKMMGCSWKV